MTNREKLTQKFEDDFFSIMVNEMVQAEGEKLLEENKRLNEDDSYTVSPSLHKKCIETINRHYEKESARIRLKHLRTMGVRVAVVAVICMMLFTIACFAYEPLRYATVNLLIEVFSDHSEVSRPDNIAEATDRKSIQSLFVKWIPDEYQIVGSDNDGQLTNTYENGSGAYFAVDVLPASSQLSLSTENSDVHSIIVNGINSFYYTDTNDGQSIMFVLPLEEYNEIILISSYGVPVDDVIHIAENLEYN